MGAPTPTGDTRNGPIIRCDCDGAPGAPCASLRARCADRSVGPGISQFVKHTLHTRAGGEGGSGGAPPGDAGGRDPENSSSSEDEEEPGPAGQKEEPQRGQESWLGSLSKSRLRLSDVGIVWHTAEEVRALVEETGIENVVMEREQEALEEARGQFGSWAADLVLGRSVLLIGVGSKRLVLRTFAEVRPGWGIVGDECYSVSFNGHVDEDGYGVDMRCMICDAVDGTRVVSGPRRRCCAGTSWPASFNSSDTTPGTACPTSCALSASSYSTARRGKSRTTQRSARKTSPPG